jgi:hypothetical protein
MNDFIKNPDYMKDNFFIKIESFHSEDKGTIENVILTIYNIIITFMIQIILKYFDRHSICQMIY